MCVHRVERHHQEQIYSKALVDADLPVPPAPPAAPTGLGATQNIVFWFNFAKRPGSGYTRFRGRRTPSPSEHPNRAQCREARGIWGSGLSGFSAHFGSRGGFGTRPLLFLKPP
jgi:hypothetical protein